jgi:putative ABC transport system permease protein
MPVGGYLAMFGVLMGTTLLAPTVLRGLGYVYRGLGERLLGVSGRLAADNFARAPVRTAVPVSALAVGVAMAVCIAGFVGSFQGSTHRWIDQAVPADLFVTSSARTAGVQNQPMRPELGEAIEKLPGVESVDRVRILPHVLLGLRVYIVSIIPEIYERRAKPIFLEGRMLTPEEWGQGRVIISENLARRRDLHLGSTFEMSTPTGVRTYTVGAVAVDYTSDQGTVVLSRDVYVAQFQDSQVDVFEAYLADPGKLEEVRRAITEAHGRQYNLYVLSNSELRDEAMSLVDDAFTVTYAMEAVAVLLALLGVINTLLAAVLDRTREIGLLRAVGAARAHVLRLFVGEAALIGLSGGLIGVLSGTVLGLIITQMVSEQSLGWSFPYVFPTGVALQMSLTATLCAAVAGLYPARRAAALDVVEALAYE